MILIRPETAEDIPAIHDVHCAAFGQQDEAQLVDNLRNTADFIADLSLVAIDDNELVGHILFSPIRIERPGHSTPALALAPMAVRPDHQRKGVGSELVRAGFSRARELGHRLVVVVGHPDYYPRFGFKPARPRRIEVPFPVPDEAFMILELTEGALDGVSGMVHYPLPFHATD